MMPIGILIQKFQCHDAYSVKKPPRAGPSTGANRAGQIVRPIAETISDFRALRRTRIRPTGNSTAPPAPWSARAIANSGRFCARPHATDARVNAAIETRNTRLAPNRSESQAAVGMPIVTALPQMARDFHVATLDM